METNSKYAPDWAITSALQKDQVTACLFLLLLWGFIVVRIDTVLQKLFSETCLQIHCAIKKLKGRQKCALLQVAIKDKIKRW